jgi:hypothetical protein
MRHSTCVALAASLALTGSIAEAGPARHRHAKKLKHRAKVAPPVVEETTASDERIDSPEAERPAEDDSVDVVETHPTVHAAAAPARRDDWHVAIGPYLWASSVDANVSLGSSSVATGIDFIQLTRHAKYGAELLGEVRYGRLSLTSDVMYGVVGVSGARDVGPLMVTLDGTASSTLVDSAVGYALVGDDRSVVAIEARGGGRYQRTAIAGALAVSGSTVTEQRSVDAGLDGVAGTRVVVRPSRWFSLSGIADLGLVGSSTSTWSAAADASLRVTSRVQLSVGWRTLTLERANLSVVMHGPRAALQLLF